MDIFAEIEIPASSEPSPKPLVSVPISAGAVSDPIRQKFYDMRGMASDNPYTWNDARLFFRQAKFMESFADDYASFAEFSMHYPCYQRMGYERLRTYFTWRAALRRGETVRTALSYVFLHIYELLSCIGKNSPEEALAGLVSLRKAYAPQFPALENYLPTWLTDFHIYYNIPLVEYENDTLSDWNAFSSYDITKSKFYADNADLLTECFPYVVRALTALAGKKSMMLREIFSHTSSQFVPWQPFRRAIFHPHFNQPDRTTILPNGQVYTVTDNKFATRHITPYAHKKDLAAYIIKKTESLLRQHSSYKKITANPILLQIQSVTMPEITHAIESAVVDFYKEKNRVEIKINHANLTRIREEAEDITEKLIVEEVPSPLPSMGVLDIVEKPVENSFADVLTSIEKEAIRLIHRDGDMQKIKAFAKDEGLMLEILIDGINEKAMDMIGDNLIDADSDIAIYDDYLSHLQTFL
ncbi:MAG: TerB N-terminal domain-containing protein [Defluviitaleaceae bacterium]|nr:TerB N-terminal domain-containing protein [Defluviitaleaceae bacterium]